MTADQYVESILARYAVPRGPNSPAERLFNSIVGELAKWAQEYLDVIRYSGSYAKQTGVHGVSDVDVFVSLKPNTPGDLKDLYEHLHRYCRDLGWNPRKQDVSIGVSLDGAAADIVPGRVQAGFQNYHSLYRRKKDSWTQTNVSLHVETVRNSGRTREIRALKIWRSLHGLDFPSLYLELFTIDSLSGRPTSTLAENVLLTLATVATSLRSARVVDPANSNNVLSEDLSAAEKREIADVAAQSAAAESWGSILW